MKGDEEMQSNQCTRGINKEGKELESTFLQNNLTSEENLLWPKNPEHVYKTELLDLSFCVFNYTCPNAMISKEYQQIIRELFMYHMNKVWDGEEISKHVSNDEQLRRTTYWLSQCSVLVKNNESKVKEVMFLRMVTHFCHIEVSLEMV